jgi:hypothetical protein
MVGEGWGGEERGEGVTVGAGEGGGWVGGVGVAARGCGRAIQNSDQKERRNKVGDRGRKKEGDMGGGRDVRFRP